MNFPTLFLITFLNSPVLWYSQSIMSKNIGIVAFRSSTSGMRVISKMGPTIPGIKQILFWPKTEWQIRYFRREEKLLEKHLGQAVFYSSVLTTYASNCLRI